MTEPLDPAKVMADHEGHTRGCRPWLLGDVSHRRCEPYLLAAALAEANRKLAAVEARVRRARGWFINSVDPAEVGLEAKQQVLDRRASLGGDQ